MTASAPQTEREILNSLHLSGRRRPWYASLFDEENNRGFGIRHITILAISVTVCLTLVSLVKSTASKVPTMPTQKATASTSSSSEEGGVSGTAAMSLHHLNFKTQGTLFVGARGKASTAECDRVKALAEKVSAPLVVIVGAVGNDVESYISECGSDDGEEDNTLVWMFTVDETIKTAMRNNILADNHFFSVVRKKAGYELLTAKTGPASSWSSPVGKRIQSSTLANKVLITNTAVKMEKSTKGLVRVSSIKKGKNPSKKEFSSLELHTEDAKGSVAITKAIPSVCWAILLQPGTKGTLTFECVDSE